MDKTKLDQAEQELLAAYEVGECKSNLDDKRREYFADFLRNHHRE